MTADSQASPPDGPPTPSAGKDEGRTRSTIEFPYFDLGSAIELANAVKHVGGTGCDITQLAVKLGMAAEGGGFRTRLMSAKTFGLVGSERGSVYLTDVGIRAVDPQYERAGKLEAFMKVPLYKALFDRLNGQTLPPAAAIERMAEQLGVAPKQKDKARQAFMRSAKTAGLFELSLERLAIPPALAGSNAQPLGGDGGGDVKRGGDEPPPPGRLRFEVPIPGKPSAVVLVPDDLDADDWEMLNAMMTTYINRWKKFAAKPEAAGVGDLT